VADPRLRFLSLLLVSAAAAWYAWLHLPSTPADRLLVKTVAAGTANPPFIIAGEGTRSAPWSLRVLAPYRKADPAHEPIVISLADDPQGIFQSSPPSPVDLAVVLKNLRRLGAADAAIAAILAWEQPDMIAIAALDQELSGFRSVVTAAALSRGATGSALPPSFRRGSISAAQIRGTVADLPAANRLSLPGVILGGDNALSGFTLLENDPDGAPMLARWDDRIVLAFPLVAVLAERGLSFEAVEVELGNFIKLGSAGPFIPIDKYGRISTVPGKLSNTKVFRAEALIDATEPLPILAGKAVLLRDDQSNAEAATRAFSKKIAPLVADISSGAGMSEEQILRRLPPEWEQIIWGTVVLALAFCSSRSRFARAIVFGLLAAVALIAHLIAATTASVWLPTLPILGCIAAAFVFSRLFFREPAHESVPAAKTAAAAASPAPIATAAAGASAVPGPEASASIPSPTVLPTPEIKKTEARKAAAGKTAATKKAPAKKGAARKVAVKKVTAKKTARPKKNPPPGTR